MASEIILVVGEAIVKAIVIWVKRLENEKE